jgi:pyruvate dehydrogenase E2 component (dihydrolipoamide acetyltransferase)
MRHAIAAAMTKSHREIPHYYLARSVDLEATLSWLEERNRERPPAERIIPAALFVKAVALATGEVPEMNGHWLNDGFRPAEHVNVGFGVAVPGGGLIAPAILDAGRKPLPDVMSELRDLVQRARSGSLRSSEMNEGTITVTSLGERGAADVVFGLINPPQVTLVGFGNVAERPWAERGAVVARRQVTLSLSGDHRANDGHSGALFLAAIERRLREPDRL